jgi:hypothetical protein
MQRSPPLAPCDIASPQLFDDVGYSLIYTPPFCPEVQPIELLWAKVKRYVADRSSHNRSKTEAHEQTEEAFQQVLSGLKVVLTNTLLTNCTTQQQVTKTFCHSVMKHCHDWIDSFLRTDAAEDLQQCSTLAGVIKSFPLLKLAGFTQQQSNTTPAAPIQLPSAPPAAPVAPPIRTLRKRH